MQPIINGLSKMKAIRNKKNILLLLIGAIFICLFVLYLCRNIILQYIVEKKSATIEASYQLQIHYDKLDLIGLKEVHLQHLTVTPEKRDTLLSLESLNVQLNFWQLIIGNIEVHSVKMKGLNLNFTKRGSVANYEFLFIKKGPSEEEQSSMKEDYGKRTNRILELCFAFMPENGELTNTCITELRDSNLVKIKIPSFVVKNHIFQSSLEIQEDTTVQNWQTSGVLNQSSGSINAKLYSLKQKKIVFPYIECRYGARISFDTLSFSLSKERSMQNKLHLYGHAKVRGLEVFHKALSPEVIHLDQGQLTYQLNLGKRSVELDSTSSVIFNKLQFHPYLLAEKEKEHWHFRAAIDKPWFAADDLFSSLPKGLFNNLEGIKTKGELSYHFLLDINLAQVDSMKLESELKERNFKIDNFGATNLNKMAGEFVYTAYERDMPVRTFSVGPSWEHFTPLDSISPLLQTAVMQSEDGAFYYHRGFLPDALREALIYDIKTKRFARGGSTITMQLVKNVFLNKRKNFARKLEEALIVWLIENQKLTSKARMYEVYLNIAEWGPLVYGIHEASAYYFNKRPSQLTAQECIFLASIIPKPKHFRNSFKENGQLKDHLNGYFKLIAGRLVKKGLITEIEADSIRPEVTITGEALNSVVGESPKPKF